jgi:hypothetical protein
MILHVPEGGLSRSSDVDLSDLTTAARAGGASWVGDQTLEIPFDTEPTDAEQAAIRLRLLTRDAAHEAQVKAMRSALTELRASPTTPRELADAVALLLEVELGDLA